MSGTQPRLTTQGMIGPQEFVQPSGDLTAVSFRFLAGLLTMVQQLQADVATLQQRLTTAGIP